MQEGLVSTTTEIPGEEREPLMLQAPSCSVCRVLGRACSVEPEVTVKRLLAGANTQEQGVKDLEFEKPSCLVEALNGTPLKGVRTTNQCEEPQAEMSRLVLGQRGAPKHSRAHLRVWSSRHGGPMQPLLV